MSGLFNNKFPMQETPKKHQGVAIQRLQICINWAKQQEPLGIGLILLMAAGTINAFHLITKLAINHLANPVLNGDSWLFAIRGDYSSNSLAWLLEQHNEHRIFLSKLATLIETDIFHIPPTSTALLQGEAILIISSFLIFIICKLSLKSLRLQILSTLACILILTNPWQYENLYWEFQAPWHWSNFLVLTGTLLLILWNKQQKKSTEFILLILASIIPWAAIYCIGQGIAVATSFCLVSLYKSKKLFIANATSTSAALIIYFIALPYKKPLHHPPISFDFDYLSKILFGGPWQGLAILIFIFTIYILLSPKPWEALKAKYSSKANCDLLLPGIFTAIFAIMTTLSRSGFGIAQASSSRYVSHSLMLAISGVLIISNLIDKDITDKENRKNYAYKELFPAFAVTATTIFSFPQLIYQFPTDLYIQTFAKAAEFQKKSLRLFKCPAISIALMQSQIQPTFDCKELLPMDPSIPFQYLNGKLPLKPLGWHKSLVGESKLNTNLIRNNLFIYAIDQQNQAEVNKATISKPLNSKILDMKGWAFLSNDHNSNIFIIAEYPNGTKQAYPVNLNREDVNTLYNLKDSLVGFEAQIPIYNGNSALSRILLASKYGSTELPIQTNSR